MLALTTVLALLSSAAALTVNSPVSSEAAAAEGGRGGRVMGTTLGNKLAQRWLRWAELLLPRPAQAHTPSPSPQSPA